MPVIKVNTGFNKPSPLTLAQAKAIFDKTDLGMVHIKGAKWYSNFSQEITIKPLTLEKVLGVIVQQAHGVGVSLGKAKMQSDIKKALGLGE